VWRHLLLGIPLALLRHSGWARSAKVLKLCDDHMNFAWRGIEVNG
jgi:hypothetical protein